MKKLFSNPVFAVIFSFALIVFSSLVSVRMKASALSPPELMQHAMRFPGNFFLGSLIP